MTKPEWGTKRVCGSCGAHFYDMRKATIVCPKCKTVYDPDAVMKSRRRVAEKMTPVKQAAEEEPILPDVEADEEALGDEEDDSVLEDASELGEDDEDIEIVETGDEEER
ncbi:TIGR02300 family protein [Dongia mobilis]|uniref:TIGR02300 family protein n=1 Tax=Dongia mobilis TaxID=578943 RepID=UPI00106115E4|nr:TIGR02300 family protein [Dongia mobilis]